MGQSQTSLSNGTTRDAIPFPPVTEIDKTFYAECYTGAAKRGWPPETINKYLPGGVVMGSTGYSHLSNRSTRILIAIYTACGIYLDDVFKKDVEVVSLFNQRFFEHAPQGDPVLDCFAQVLLELGSHFERVVSNIMVTSTLNAVSALTLEASTQGMTMSPSALGYPTFSRVMSGASEAYALFIFPCDLALPGFVQTLQQVMIFINNGNDILSFYKEDLDGESVNRISFLAAQSGRSKQAVLAELVEEAIKAYTNVLAILAPKPEALAAFRAFAAGYIGFHATATRYRLDELKL
ncbi:isoprenoid synthase domain-containing protein [Mycena rosella]|uniref:Isoprenoid synthase domain-containing protein n=1 Tax=Mycena rosella TaxID=1033263 RepID=A0AAD7GVU4_MYCRO|nr:isoprenoid synthase domain-containing protein [Mycena rosella]